jgi:exosortase family protein XrtF
MLDSLKQNRFLKFLITSSVIYLSLYLFYVFVIQKHTNIDVSFIRVIIRSSDVVLHWFGYDTFTRLDENAYPGIGIDGSTGVWVGASCNALTLFFLFAVFVFAYPGHQKSKLWFIPMGIITIHVLNILRVVALALISFYKPDYLAFNHTYTFTFIVYCYIFFLWMIWVNNYSVKEADAKK